MDRTKAILSLALHDQNTELNETKPMQNEGWQTSMIPPDHLEKDVIVEMSTLEDSISNNSNASSELTEEQRKEAAILGSFITLSDSDRERSIALTTSVDQSSTESSIVTQQEMQGAVRLGSLITLSDLQENIKDSNDGQQLRKYYSENTFSRPYTPLDFSSDDSTRDKTYQPTETLSESSSEGESSINPPTQNLVNINTDLPNLPNNIVAPGNNTVDEEPVTSGPRKKKGVNKKREIQEKRNKGLSYTTKKGKIVSAKKVAPLSNCRQKCFEKVSFDEQRQLFSQLWSLGDYNKRVLYLSSLVHDTPKKNQRIRNTGGQARPRGMTHIYHVQINGKLTVVCKGCFLKTFGVTNKHMETILKKKSNKISGISSPDKRGSSVPSNKLSEDTIQFMKDHITSFPLYESHYSRSHTNKKYFPTGLTMSKLYDLYKLKVSNPVSLTFFRNIFHTMGISFKKPSLDTCNLCDTYNMKIKLAQPSDKENLQRELNLHQSGADNAYESKKTDKKEATESIRVYCFDLQQCLPTPYLQTNIVFYKRLLWTFNLTIYDYFTKKSICYMWHEAEGGRGANQIASCLFNFISTLPPHIKEVTFYSDTCGGQNKNSHVAVMFLCATKIRPDLKISHKFLIPGHTHMECDTVHAQIEKRKKNSNMNIHVPRDWYNLIRGNKNTNVFIMKRDMFLDFAQLLKDPLQLRKVDTLGEKFAWHNVRWFQYSAKHEPAEIKFKYTLDRSAEFKSISFCRRGKADAHLNPRKCYDKPVQISNEKKADLISILHLIDTECHQFYHGLHTNATVRNTNPDIFDGSDSE